MLLVHEQFNSHMGIGSSSQDLFGDLSITITILISFIGARMVCIGPVVARSTEDRNVPGSNHNMNFSGHKK